MRTAEEVFARAREVSKSQLRNGEYVPANKLTDLGRKRQLESVRTGSYKRFKQGPKGPNIPKGRSMKDVYSSHGVGPGINRAMTEELRQSKVHSNVHFGSSVSPAMEERINRELKPDLIRSSKAPIAFHHGKLDHNVMAAAAGNHVTTGGKARVILNSSQINAEGKMGMFSDVSFHEVLNHETGHATVSGKNPFRFIDYKGGKLNQAKTLGEEGRADARGVHGRGLYSRNGIIESPERLKYVEANLQRGGDFGHLSESMKRTQFEAIRGHRNYHAVHAKVQEKYGTKDAWAPPPKPQPPPRHEPPRGGPSYKPPGGGWEHKPNVPLGRIKLIGTTPRGVVGAAAGAAALGAGVYGYHRWEEHKHRRGHGGKFVAKSFDVDYLFLAAREV